MVSGTTNCYPDEVGNFNSIKVLSAPAGHCQACQSRDETVPVSAPSRDVCSRRPTNSYDSFQALRQRLCNPPSRIKPFQHRPAVRARGSFPGGPSWCAGTPRSSFERARADSQSRRWLGPGALQNAEGDRPRGLRNGLAPRPTCTTGVWERWRRSSSSTTTAVGKTLTSMRTCAP